MLLLGSTLTATAQEEIITHEGNKYTIHLERLDPDPEMTLLDVLHLCPELMSGDGKSLTANYLLSVDDIFLSIDYGPLLENIRACDLSEVIVCTYGAVNNATDGTTGTIDLQFRQGKGLSGKLGLSGSTYGNGQLYADVASQGEKVTMRAFAQTNQQYGKANSLTGTTVTSRNCVENAMFFVDWQATECDLLKLKLSQGYGEQKDRLRHTNADVESETTRQRWGEIVVTYDRTLNDREAALYIESGFDYINGSADQTSLRTAAPWLITECSIPFFQQSLWMTAGWEGTYSNLWHPGISREQSFYHDLYLQFDYTHGPWIISLGDRLRHNHFWHRLYNKGDGSLWSYRRHEHAFLASVGWQHRRHFLQATLGRSFFNPYVSDFFDYLDEGPVNHNTSYKTNLAWRSEARYTYQTPSLVATASLTHTRLSDLPTPDESLTTLATSVTWHQGPLRLTAGAKVSHCHISFNDPVSDTFFTLKLAPTLLFGKGFRLSSTLIYNSRKELDDTYHPHLYASLNVNKDLSRRCNIFADFHDLAGQPTGETYQLLQSFKNRALTLGLTYYPWR